MKFLIKYNRKSFKFNKMKEKKSALNVCNKPKYLLAFALLIKLTRYSLQVVRPSQDGE